MKVAKSFTIQMYYEKMKIKMTIIFLQTTKLFQKGVPTT